MQGLLTALDLWANSSTTAMPQPTRRQHPRLGDGGGAFVGGTGGRLPCHPGDEE
jgi:hypothetical protein